MPEDQNIIFKLQLEASGYITGVNTAADVTGRKFVDAQRKANDELIKSKANLADVEEKLRSLNQQLEFAKAQGVTDRVTSTQAALDVATAGLEKQKQIVLDNQKAYDDSTKAAQSYFETVAKAQTLVQANVPAPVPNAAQLALPFQEPGAQLSLFDQIPQGVSQAVGDTTDQFKALSDQVTELDQELQKLDSTSQEFQQLTAFKDFASSLVNLHDSLNLIGDSSEESRKKLTEYRDELQRSTDVMKLYVSTLDKSSDAYKSLNPLLNESDAILKIYNQSLAKTGDAAKASEVKHITFRQQLLNLRNEMGALSEAGKEDTDQFRAMEKEAAHLTEEYRIQQTRLHILSSETRALDFGKSAIQGAIAGFQTLASVEVLFGTKQEELEKITLKLFAAMQLLNGIEELERLTKRDSTIVTLTQAAATRAYTFVTEAATVASKVFRAALLSTVVGAVVVGIGVLIAKFIALKDAQEKAGREAKILSDIEKSAADSYASQVTNIELLRSKLNDTNLSIQQRTAFADEYNKVAEVGNQIDTTQLNNLTLINQQMDKQIALIEQRAIATAGENAAASKAADFFKVKADFDKAASDQIFKTLVPGFKLDLKNLDKQITDLQKKGEDLVQDYSLDLHNVTQKQILAVGAVLTGLKDIRKAQVELQQTSKVAASLLTTPTIVPGSIEEAIQKKTEEIEKLKDDLKKTQQSDTKRRADLQAQITKAEKELSALQGKVDTTAQKAADTFQSEFDALDTKRKELESQLDTSVASIAAKFKAALQQELDKIDRLKIPKKKKEVLIDLAIKVNELEQKKAIDDFTQRQVDATNKIDDQIKALQDKANTASVNNLQEQFTKRAAIINDNQNKEIGDAHRLSDQLLRELDKDKQAGLLNEQQYQEDRVKTIENSEQLINQITIKFSKQRQELAVETFTQNLKRFDDAVEQITSTADERIAEVVRTQSQRFTSGSINFATFQKNVQDQTRVIQAKSRDDIIKQRTAEVFETQLKLDTIRDRTTQAYADLKKKREDLSNELTQLEKTDAEADAADVEAKSKDRIDAITGYADAIGSVAQSVVAFWQAANDAEERALERSIALQQRRVDEALKIADRGNASYLKSETDRLKQLEVERANSARRQLGVDAALQASQILVGITGAIAKIGTGTPAETIADIAVIIGALATGYGLIKQLQVNQPKFKEGTPYVQRGVNKAGVDTVPAWLNEGEAVIPTETNRLYKPVIEAVYHEKVPAEVMNSFVKGYKSNMTEKDYSKLDERSKLVYKLYNVTKKHFGQQYDEKLISKVKNSELKSYTETINTVFNKQAAEKHLTITQIPEAMKDVVFDAHKTISPFKMDRERDTSYEKGMINFVDHFYELKQAPQPNYEHIAAVNELKMGYDGRMKLVLEEQNDLIRMNNEHQKETQRILKAMGISMSIDRNGVAAIAMDAIKQKQIDAKL